MSTETIIRKKKAESKIETLRQMIVENMEKNDMCFLDTGKPHSKIHHSCVHHRKVARNHITSSWIHHKKDGILFLDEVDEKLIDAKEDNTATKRFQRKSHSFSDPLSNNKQWAVNNEKKTLQHQLKKYLRSKDNVVQWLEKKEPGKDTKNEFPAGSPTIDVKKKRHHSNNVQQHVHHHFHHYSQKVTG